jgi:hypothetical protein
MAPVTFGSAAGVGASNPTTIAKPASTVQGDYLLLCQVDDMDTTLAQMTTPTGGSSWGTELFSSSVTAAHVKIWGKIAGASEPASYGIAGASTADRSASITRIPAGTFDPAQPMFSGPTATTNISNVTAHITPSINSVIDGLLITLHCGSRNTNVARTYTPPTGMTERIDTQQTSGYSGWVAHEVATLALTAGGTTGTKSATISAAAQHCSVALVIKPAPAVSAPVADAGADADVETGSEFARTGSGTNTPTSYSWSLTSAPAGVTTGVVAAVAALSYTPTVAGTYVFTLSATNAGGTGTDTVTLTVTDPAVSSGTLGKTTDGPGSSASSSNKVAASKFTSTGSGTLTAGHARVWITAGGTPALSKLVVYADSAGAPGALLAASDEITISNTTEAVNDYVFSGGNQISIVSGTDYWIGPAWADPGSGVNDSVNVSRDNTAAGRQEVNTYAPNPFGTPTAQSGPVDAWVEYGFVGGGGSGSTILPVIRSWSEGISSTTSMTTAKPAGLDVDDYLLAWHTGDADNTAMTAAGFTQLAGQAATSATNIPMERLWGKVATSGDVAASTFSFGNTSSATPAQSVTLIAIQKGTYDPTTPVTIGTWLTSTRGAAGSGVALQTVNSITGVVDGLLLALFGVDANGNVQTYPGTSGSMSLVNQAQSGSGYSLQAVYSEALTAAGATGTRTVTPSGTNTSNGWATLPVIINPATAPAIDSTKFFLAAV